MIKLERVYLLNVLIYINEIYSTRRFLEINKKCREVGNMLRIYSAKVSYNQTKNIPIKFFILRHQNYLF